jgi:hypothetical protein
MTELLGNEIPESCFSLLTSENLSRGNTVIILLTVDDTGFPRVCLLSPFQVLLANTSEIYFEVYPNSHTKQNLDRTKIATFVFQESTGLIYVCGEAKYLNELSTPEESSQQSLYCMKVMQVTRDSFEVAPINSQLTFDTSIIGSQYQKGFELFRSYIKGSRPPK